MWNNLWQHCQTVPIGLYYLSGNSNGEENMDPNKPHQFQINVPEQQQNGSIDYTTHRLQLAPQQLQVSQPQTLQELLNQSLLQHQQQLLQQQLQLQQQQFHQQQPQQQHGQSTTPTRNKQNKRHRSAFTTTQVEILEEEYKKNPYLDAARREMVSRGLNLSERALKIWFQNRRMKDRRDEKEQDEEQDIDFEFPNHINEDRISTMNLGNLNNQPGTSTSFVKRADAHNNNNVQHYKKKLIAENSLSEAKTTVSTTIINALNICSSTNKTQTNLNKNDITTHTITNDTKSANDTQSDMDFKTDVVTSNDATSTITCNNTSEINTSPPSSSSQNQPIGHVLPFNQNSVNKPHNLTNNSNQRSQGNFQTSNDVHYTSTSRQNNMSGLDVINHNEKNAQQPMSYSNSQPGISGSKTIKNPSRPRPVPNLSQIFPNESQTRVNAITSTSQVIASPLSSVCRPPVLPNRPCGSQIAPNLFGSQGFPFQTSPNVVQFPCSSQNMAMQSQPHIQPMPSISQVNPRPVGHLLPAMHPGSHVMPMPPSVTGHPPNGGVNNLMKQKCQLCMCFFMCQCFCHSVALIRQYLPDNLLAIAEHPNIQYPQNYTGNKNQKKK